MIRKWTSYGAASLLALSSIGSGLQAQTAVAVAPPPVEAGPAGQVTAANGDQDYRLGSADKIRVIVFNEETLSGEFLVNSNGSVSFPLIGDVPAQGKTPGQLAMEIRNRLADGYLKEPRVSIDVLTFRPFYILGEVTKPGEYPYSSGLTVLNAVATASGFTYRANKKRAFIKHPGDDTEQAAKLTPDLKVRAGDTIRIGERYF